MYKCQFHPDKDCQFPHKCQNVGCSYEPFTPEGRKYRTEKLPWQRDLKQDESKSDDHPN